MGESASITELDAVRPRHGDQARGVRGGRARRSCRCSRTAAASITASISTFPCATWCRSRCRSRIRRCGWPARSCRPSNAPAEYGFGALGFQFVSADAAHAWVHAYYNAITKRLKKLADYEINPNMALVSFFMCAKTDEEARARADGATFFQFALRFYGASQNRQRPAPGTVNMWDEYNKWKRDNPEAQEAALRGGLIGSPETIRRKLRRFQASHIDQVILLNQAGKNTPRAHLRIAGAVRPGGDAGIPERSRRRRRGSRRDERRDRARGDRHRGLHRPLRQARGQRRAGEGGGGVGCHVPQQAIPGMLMTKHRIYTTSFASVYPLYVAKAEKKGRTKAEVDQVISWLTGYGQKELEAQLEQRTEFETFFAKAPKINPSRALIKGVVCGVRVEDVKEPTMREIRYLDKLIDELAKGKAMDKILRKSAD